MLNLSEEFFEDDWTYYHRLIEEKMNNSDLNGLLSLAENFSIIQNTFGLDEACIEAIESLINQNSKASERIIKSKSDSYVLQRLRLNLIARGYEEKDFHELDSFIGKSTYKEILEIDSIDLRNFIEFAVVSETPKMNAKITMIALALTEKLYPDSMHETEKWKSLDGKFQRIKALFLSSDSSLEGLNERKRIIKESELNGVYSHRAPNLGGLLFAITKRDFAPGRISIWEEEIELLSPRECLILIQIICLLREDNPIILKDIILYPTRKILLSQIL